MLHVQCALVGTLLSLCSSTNSRLWFQTRLSWFTLTIRPTCGQIKPSQNWIVDQSTTCNFKVYRPCLCVYQTGLNWVLDVQCALVGTPLSLLQWHQPLARTRLSWSTLTVVVQHVDRLYLLKKEGFFFFIYFLLVCFHEKNKTSKAVCRQSLLANIDVCGPTYVKNCTSEKKKSAIFLQCTVYLLYGKAYWLIFLKKNYIFTLSFFCANSRIKNIFVIVP